MIPVKSLARNNREEVAFSDANEAGKNLMDETKETKSKNGIKADFLVLSKNVPFLLIIAASLPAVAGLYIPYYFIPIVRTFPLL